MLRQKPNRGTVGAQKFTGIDLGNESVKCVVVSGAKGSIRVESCHTENIKAGEGIEWRDAVSAVLTKWRKEKIIGDTPVCINTPAHDTIIRALKVDADTSAADLQNEINEQLPFDLEVIEYSDAVVGEKDGQNQIIVVAAKKTVVAEVMDICKEAGVAVDAINAASVAGGNILLHAGGSKVTTPTAILDLGHAASSLTVVDGSKLWVRSLPVTGKAIVEALAKELDITDTAARETLLSKVQLAGAANDADTATGSVRKTLTRLVMEITRSLTFYRAQFGGNKPEKIAVTGDYSGIPGLVNFLEERAKTPTEMLDVFAGIEAAPESDAQLYIAALGLALQNAGFAEYALTLVPRNVLAQRTLNKKKPWLVISVFLLAAAMATLFVTAKMKVKEAQAENNEVYTKLEKVQKFDKELDSFQTKLNAELQVNKGLQQVLWERDLYTYVLEEIAQRIPSNMWLSGIQNITFGNIYDSEVATADSDSGFSYMMIEDEKVLGRTVRIFVKGGYYGEWQKSMEQIIKELTTIPGIAKVEQEGLTQFKKYSTMNLALDLDIDRNGVADLKDIKNVYMPQRSSRR